MKEIKYVGYYDVLRDGKQIRSYALAGAKKMDFVAQTLEDLHFKVEIISPSYIKGIGHKKYAQERIEIKENIYLNLPPSIEADNKIQRVYRVLLSRFWLFNYLIKNCRKDEKVLVYHNYSLALPVVIAAKIKGFRIILEIEDIFHKVWKISPYHKWKEKLLIRNSSDKHLVVSEVMEEELNLKESIISYGSYIISNIESSESSIHENTRLVFTGSIDKDRGSGFIAVQAMEFLPDNYTLSISGPIAKKDHDDFMDEIARINQLRGREVCSYLGVLPDKEYGELLQQSDIALNPQKEGEFSKYVFPSKILTYLSNGLPVVSTQGESIVRSSISDLIIFADEFTPESVAKAILSVHDIDKQAIRDRIRKLAECFKEELSTVFED